MNGTDKIVHVAWGSADKAAHQLVAHLLQKKPDIVWREPVPTRQPLRGFVGLWCGHRKQLANNLPEAALDEARLYWQGEPAGAIHLVSAIYGQAHCTRARWAAFWLAAGATSQPHWVDSNVLGSQEGTKTVPFDCEAKEAVLTMAERDRNRYGIVAVCHPGNIRKLKLHKYISGTALVFWRLSAEQPQQR